MGHFPPNFRSLLAAKLLVGHKSQSGRKMIRTCYIYMPSLVAILRRTAAREEKIVFLFVFLPAGQPPVLNLLRCPILRFFAPQGRHDSRINVKFGTAEGTFDLEVSRLVCVSHLTDFNEICQNEGDGGSPNAHQIWRRCVSIWGYTAPKVRIKTTVFVPQGNTIHVLT